MRTLAACLFVLASVSLASARGDDEWIDFAPKGGKFTVKLPGKPKDVSREVDSPAGKLKVRIFGYEDGDAGAYLVSYTDFPEGVIDQDDLPTHLDGVQNGIVSSSKGKLQTKKNVKVLKKYAGREITYTVPAIKGTGRVRMFFVGDRLYQLMALGTDEFMESDNITTFLDSFKLTK